jgi:hypothetical protein
MAEIDSRLAELDEQLSAHEQLLQERERLRAARATLRGESALGRISQDDVSAYLAEHPGARPGEIANALGVSTNRVSAHLFRGKGSRFVSRRDGWYVREAPKRGLR